MADLATVETAMAVLIAGIVYPNGIENPSIANCDVRVMRGWPNSRALDDDMNLLDANGQPKRQVSNITVYADPKLNRNISRYQRQGYVVGLGQNTLDAVVTHDTDAAGNPVTFVSFNGTADLGQIVSIISQGTRTGYAAQHGDTLASIVTALAATIPNALAAGPVLAITGANPDFQIAVSALDSLVVRAAQMRGVFRVTMWCPDIPTRDALAGPVEAALAMLDWLQIPNDVPAQIELSSTTQSDVSESANLYRRDSLYTVTYETTTAPTLAARAAFGGSSGTSTASGGAGGGGAGASAGDPGTGPGTGGTVSPTSPPAPAAPGDPQRGGLTVNVTTPDGPTYTITPA